MEMQLVYRSCYQGNLICHSIKVIGIYSDTLLNFGGGGGGWFRIVTCISWLRHLTIDSILYYEFYVDSYYCSIVAVQVSLLS
jgi:hypothetical protein